MADTREVVIKVVDGNTKTNKTALSENNEKLKEVAKVKDFINNPVGSTISAIKSDMSVVDAMAFSMIAYNTISLVQNGVNFYTSNIGRFTGDIVAQRTVENINVGLGVVKSAGNILTSALSGFVLSGGNPVGAIIGGTTALISTGVNYGTQAFNYGTNVATDNRSVMFVKLRAGNELNNWSR